MPEFKVVDYASLDEEMKQEALRRIYSVYSGLKSMGPFAQEFMDFTHKHCETRCMLEDGKLAGVVAFKEENGKLMAYEMWAKPSREFLLKNGMTIGRKLTLLTQGVAKKRGLKFEVGGFMGPGKRFGRRLRGELHYVPKKMGEKKRAVLPKRRK